MIFKASKIQWKKICLAGMLVMLMFAFSCSQALAQSDNEPSGGGFLSGLLGIGSIAVSAINTVIKAILYLVLYTIGLAIAFAGYLTGAALDFNQSILKFNPPFIIIGWTIFRDIANLGFVLGIIVIALGTILRYKNYRVQTMLPKLIGSALIVNFSLFLGGILIQVSNYVAAYLLSYIGGGSSMAVAKMGDSFRFIKLVKSVSGYNSLGGTESFGDTSTTSRLGAMFILIVFGVVMFLTLLGYCATLFLRYFYLSFLLMLAPVAWLLWAFPTTARHFTKWWELFIKWVMQAPIILLFMYVALAVIDSYESYIAKYTAEFQAGQGGGRPGFNIDYGTLLTSLIATAMLIGGLKMAQSMGYSGASMGINAFDKGKKWVTSKAKGRLKTMRSNAGVHATALKGKAKSSVLTSKAGKFTQEKINQGASTKVGRALGLGAAARGFEEAKMGADKQKMAVINQEEERLKKFSPDQLKNLWGTFNDNQKAVALEQISTKGNVTDIPLKTDELVKHLDDMDKRGRGKQAASIEKKVGMSRDMMRAMLDPGKKTTIEQDRKDDEGNVIKDSNGNPIKEKVEKTYNELASDFYGKFGKADWRTVASGAGKSIFAKKPHPLLNKEDSALFEKPYIDGMNEDFGNALHSTLATIENPTQQKTIYKKLAQRIAENLPPPSVTQRPGSSLDASGHPIMIEERGRDFRGEIEALLEQDDTDFAALARLLRASGNNKAKTLAEKISKGIGASLTGAYKDEDEKKS